MGRTACTEPQCLYKGALYLYLTVELYLYSPYRPYGLYRASVPVQGCTLPLLFTVCVLTRSARTLLYRRGYICLFIYLEFLDLFRPLKCHLKWNNTKLRKEITRIFTHIIQIITYSVARQVHSLVQSQFSTECDLVLPHSFCNIPSFL